ncbi:MAG: hypothetical protein DDT19_00714 [Syntrophomonadaceae bacterium]|nr:hypothetical protein [Bacillota bacterium]
MSKISKGVQLKICISKSARTHNLCVDEVEVYRFFGGCLPAEPRPQDSHNTGK